MTVAELLNVQLGLPSSKSSLCITTQPASDLLRPHTRAHPTSLSPPGEACSEPREQESGPGKITARLGVLQGAGGDGTS